MTRARLSNMFGCLAVLGLCGVHLACTNQQPNPEPAASAPAVAAPAAAGGPADAPATPAATTGVATNTPEGRSAAARPTPAAPAATRPAPVEPAPVKAPPPPPPPRRFTLAAQTTIAVYTTSALSTAVNKTSERFSATLAEPIVDGDWTIARRGAPVEGVVVDADPGGRTKGVASITLALTQLMLADGRTIDVVTSNVTEQANTSKGKDAKKIGIGAGIGAAIGAVAGGGSGAAIGAALGGGAGTAAALATRGDPATVPTESLVTFVLTSPITITRVSTR
jgi:hypothetical protein